MKNYKIILIAFILTLSVALAPIIVSNYLEKKTNISIDFPKYQAFESGKSLNDLRNSLNYPSYPAIEPVLYSLNTESLISKIEIKKNTKEGNNYNNNKILSLSRNDYTKNILSNKLKLNLNRLSGQTFNLYLNSTLLFQSDWSLHSAGNSVDLIVNKIPVLPDEPYAAGFKKDYPAMLIFPLIYAVYLIFFRYKSHITN